MARFLGPDNITDEAVEVLGADPDANNGLQFDARRRLRDPRDILTICSSLVTISDQQIHPGEYSENGDINTDQCLTLFARAAQTCSFLRPRIFDLVTPACERQRSVILLFRQENCRHIHCRDISSLSAAVRPA